MPTEFLPWQAALRDRVQRQAADGRLPHALLLRGQRFLGKRKFANALAEWLLCERRRQEGACGDCGACHLVAAGSHPDVRHVSPEGSKQILIEQIRDLINWSARTAGQAGYRVVIIEPAEQMNISAANALLKCLEEPGDDLVLLLVSDLPGRLLPTIRSRCQDVPFTVPDPSVARLWLDQHEPGDDNSLMLALAGGAPLAVAGLREEAAVTRRLAVWQGVARLAAGDNPLEVAASINSGEPAAELQVLHDVFADALRLVTSEEDARVRNQDQLAILRQLAGMSNERALCRILTLVTSARGRVLGTTNPNILLLFEGLMVRISEVLRTGNLKIDIL